MKVREAQESLATQLTPLARELISFSMQLADLAQRSGLAERSAEQVTNEALRGHLKRGIDHLSLLLDSDTQQIKENGATTLGVMVRCNSAFKGDIASDHRILSSLTKLMNEGVLEAVSAVELLLAGNEEACNQARKAGAIAILAAFISIEDGEGGKDGGSGSGGGGGKHDERARRAEERKNSRRKGPPKVMQMGTYDLADLDADML
jgi:hypothetical protein